MRSDMEDKRSTPAKISAEKKKPSAKSQTKGKKKPASQQKQVKKPRSDSENMTFIKIVRSIRHGGATTVKYTGTVKRNIDSLAEDAQFSIRRPSRVRKLRFTFPLFIAISVVVLLFALLALDNNSITVDRQTVSVAGLPKELEGYTILHLSDMHAREYGDGQAALLRTISGLSYNIVVMSGDMVGRSGNAEPLYTLLEGMTPKRPVFFIEGDSDPPPLLEEARDIEAPLNRLVLADWILGAQEREAIYLSSPARLDVGSSAVWISRDSQLSLNLPETVELMEDQLTQEREGAALGIQNDYDSLPFTEYRHNQMMKVREAASDMADKCDLHISVAHYPPTSEYVEISQAINQVDNKTYLSPADLILAGHYCGGGWKLPGIGAFYIPNTLLPRHGWFPNQSDVQGLKNMGITTLYTSAGLAMTDRILLPKFRFSNRPQVSLITLTSAITEDLLGG